MGDGSLQVGQVERVDVGDDDAMSAAYTIWRAAYTEEFPDDPLPTAPEVLARARGPEISGRSEFWLLRDAGEPVGVYELELPLADNLDLVDLSLAVAPEHQRRGHGRVLLDHALRRIADLGRHQVIGSVNEPVDGSQNRPMRFAAAAGASRSLGEMRRTLDLTALDPARLAALRGEAERAAEGYQLVAWSGPCPDELVDGYAALVARMSTDAPMGGLDIEPEHWDAARVREREQVMATQGRRQLATAARLGSDGPLVAYTDIVTTRHDPPNAFQWDTLVLREHRGHRLGALVKVANLERLRAEAPDARRVHTWNADENTYMISINEAMGFVRAQRESAWRLDLPRDGGSDR
jgi:GNAT superfamily N-acetyltransferase